MKKKIIIWIFIIALAIGGGYWYSRSRQKQPEYITEKPKKVDLKQTISVTGEIVPEKSVAPAFSFGGKIISLSVAVGDKVEAGAEIARLDSDVLQSQLREAQWALKIQENAEKLARRHWDDLKPEQREAEKQKSERAREAVRVIGGQLEETILYAPISGMISEKKFEVGEVVSAGAPIVKIIKGDALEVEASVPESDIAKVALGQKAEIALDAFSADDIFTAEVKEIEPAATIIQDVVYYKVKFKLIDFPKFFSEKSNPLAQTLRVGMSADINILVAEKKNVLAIPKRAVKTEGDKKYVEVLKSKNQIEKKNVETGLEGDEGIVEIIQGLSSEENIIVFVKEK